MSAFSALWGGSLTIVLLLSLTLFFKCIFFHSIYGADDLSTLQVAVDWRLWKIDLWFWLILVILIGSIAVFSILLGLLEALLTRQREKLESKYRTDLRNVC